MTAEQVKKLTRWEELQTQLKKLRDDEMTLRKELVADLFDANQKEGTACLNLPNGWQLKAKKKLSYSVEGDVEACQVAIVKLGSDQLAEELFNWEASLSVSTYKKVLPVFLEGVKVRDRRNIEQLLADLITISPAAPSLELVAPKESK